MSSKKRMVAPAIWGLLAVICLRSTWAQLVQWPVAQGGNGHFYEVVPVAGGITWGNASLAATNRGGYLATITSAEENAFVFGLATQDPTVWNSGYGPWLGGMQARGAAEPAGGWSWITGEPFTYQNWEPGQPNNNQNEDRIHFGGQANRSSAWNDVGADTVNYTRGFVVEYNQHPNAIALRIDRKGIDGVELSWVSRLNIVYAIEWTENLAGQWNFLTNVVGNGGTVAAQDVVTGRRKYFRAAVSE